MSRDPNSSPNQNNTTNSTNSPSTTTNTNSQTTPDQPNQIPNTPQNLPFPLVQFAMASGLMMQLSFANNTGPMPANLGPQQGGGNNRNGQPVMFRIPAPFGPNQNQRGPIPFPLFGMQPPNRLNYYSTYLIFRNCRFFSKYRRFFQS